MEFSVATLLANFADDKLVAPKALEKKLNCTDHDSLRKLHVALDALERSGILTKERGKYRRTANDGLVEGKLRCSSKGFCFAIQDDEDAEDIYVRESQLSTAWNGDRVLVKVTKEGTRKRSPEGEVRLILERANHSVLARVKQTDDEYQAVPLDDRLLFELELDAELAQAQEAVDQLVHVEITRYPLGSLPPIGRIAQILGSTAEAASDIDIVFCKHDLPRTFPEAVVEFAKTLPKKVRKSDLKGRADLRDILTVTIDGPGVETIDDAFSLEQLDDDRWRVGVHISDVSHYIPAGSPIDNEARKRGTSVYLADTVLPMLPPPLSGHLGSLVAEHDRLAISTLITLDQSGQVLEFEFQPSVIQVDYQLNYRQVQALLEREGVSTGSTIDVSAEDLDEFEPIANFIKDLYIVTQAIRDQRHERGAFELNLPELVLPEEEGDHVPHYLSPKFQYDDEGALGAVVESSHLPARYIVTELMMLTNQLVAAHLQALAVPGIYRIHRTPSPADVQELMKLASNMDLDLTLADDEEVHSKDYQAFTQQFAASKAEKVLTYLLLSTLKPAVYSIHPGTHFGLALQDGYTHFSSPMRRYPDLLLHRVFHAIFEQGRDRRTTRSKDRVNLRHSSCHGQISWNVLPPEIQTEFEEQFAHLVGHLSEQEKLAQEAEADLEGLKKAEFMQAHTGEVFHGLITGVQSYGFFVEIEELLVEGLVHVSSLKDDWYEYRSRQQRLVGRKNRKQYRLGDRVEVQVKSVDYYRQQIDLVAVGGGSEATDEDDDDEPDTQEEE